MYLIFYSVITQTNLLYYGQKLNREAKKEFVTKFFFANTIYETTLANAFKFTFAFLQMLLTFDRKLIYDQIYKELFTENAFNQ